MSNSRPYRNKVGKAQVREGRAMPQKQAKQLSFSLVAAREMNEALVAEKTKLKEDLSKISKLLCAAAAATEGKSIFIPAEVLDDIYSNKPSVQGFYVRQAVGKEGIEVAVKAFADKDWDPDEEDQDDEDPDINDYEIPEVAGE